MDKKTSIWAIAGFIFLYFVAVFAAEFIGFAAPLCWVFAPVLGALLAAFPYRWLSLRWKGFGLGITLAAVVGLLSLAMGEMDWCRVVLIIGFGLLSDIVRLLTKKDAVAYPVLAVGNIATIVYLWARTDWYYAGALEEMSQSYADGLMTFATPLWLCIDIVLIAALAVWGYALAKRWIKEK